MARERGGPPLLQRIGQGRPAPGRQFVEQLAQPLRLQRPSPVDGNGPDTVRRRTERLDLEPGGPNGLPVRGQRGPLGAGELDRDRLDQGLTSERPVPTKRLVDDPLAGGVLIDQDGPVLALRDPVQRVDAPQQS